MKRLAEHTLPLFWAQRRLGACAPGALGADARCGRLQCAETCLFSLTQGEASCRVVGELWASACEEEKK